MVVWKNATLPMNAAAVWTNNSGGTASPPDDDCERLHIASAEISIKRIFGSQCLGLLSNFTWVSRRVLFAMSR